MKKFATWSLLSLCHCHCYCSFSCMLFNHIIVVVVIVFKFEHSTYKYIILRERATVLLKEPVYIFIYNTNVLYYLYGVTVWKLGFDSKMNCRFIWMLFILLHIFKLMHNARDIARYRTISHSYVDERIKDSKIIDKYLLIDMNMKHESTSKSLQVNNKTWSKISHIFLFICVVDETSNYNWKLIIYITGKNCLCSMLIPYQRLSSILHEPRIY